MSALEMTANGEKISGGAAKQIDEAIGLLLEAQRLVAELQRTVDHALDYWEISIVPSELWHKLESIDDRIHEALSKLGD